MIKRLVLFTLFVITLAYGIFASLGVASEAIANTTLKNTTVRIANGTGFIVQGASGKKYLMTNWHVCNSIKWNNKLRANYESGELVESTVVRLNPLSDICAGVITTRDHAALKLAKELHPLEQVYTRGYPYGVLNYTTGQYMREMSWDYFFPIEDIGACPAGFKTIRSGYGRIAGCSATYYDNMTNMYSRPGSSGSPVVNDEGNLVGIVSSWESGSDSAGMVKLKMIQEFMNGL